MPQKKRGKKWIGKWEIVLTLNLERFFIVYMITNIFKVSFESGFNARLLAEHTLDRLLLK